ncbi:NDUFB5 [Acanthosepion pharaonis]|uniref:NADH dehydrogenase [ubiquinone] 1 beta subcomplex subunit 5, mitochondrial n=1 Tax=Acanthosepion pharaonis TaxID=158019 RepID=A0A812CHM8_ACAPH|nr:NDUFB5 [Sepia pharaonis]
MVVLSALRSSCWQRCITFRLSGSSKLSQPLLRTSGVSKEVVQRMGAHKHVMEITPSRFEWVRFKNELHFYVMLGAVPLGLLTLFVNLFIGKAELADIPEGYEPKEWEYSSSPITQFIHKMWFEPLQKSYEKKMHVLHIENEKRKQLKLEARVKDMMRQNQDYMGWYYIPVSKSLIDRGREYRENVTKDLGRS